MRMGHCIELLIKNSQLYFSKPLMAAWSVSSGMECSVLDPEVNGSNPC